MAVSVSFWSKFGSERKNGAETNAQTAIWNVFLLIGSVIVRKGSTLLQLLHREP